MSKDIWKGDIKLSEEEQSFLKKCKSIIQQYKIGTNGRWSWFDFPIFGLTKKNAKRTLDHLNKEAINVKYRLK